MKQKVLDTIKKYHMIESGDKIVLGVSGGPDSICMLDLLDELKKQLNFEIVVAHVNHGIRKEAVDDETYVENFCKEKNILFFSKKEQILQIAKEQKIGTEEAGRKIRYQFFEEILVKIRWQ